MEELEEEKKQEAAEQPRKKKRIPETEKFKYTTKYVKYVKLCIMKANINNFNYSDAHYKILMHKVADDTVDDTANDKANDKADDKANDKADEKKGKKHLINVNTWKKMNNDLRGTPNYTPSKKTLAQIANYLGCDTWEEVQSNYERIKTNIEVKKPGTRTGFVGSSLPLKNPLDDVVPGDYIRVYYSPDRAIQAVYRGASKFEITGLHNIPTLDRGDMFWAYTFVVGDQFRLFKVKHNGMIYPQGFASSINHRITKVEVDKVKK